MLLFEYEEIITFDSSLFSKDIFCYQVAGRVNPDEADKDEWFVVKVIHFDKDAKE